MKVVNTPLFDLNGEPIKSGDVDLTVAVVLVNAALAPQPDGKNRLASEIASRYELALMLNKLKVGDEVDVSPELMVKLKDDVIRIYTTIISGQMLPICDGKVAH